MLQQVLNLLLERAGGHEIVVQVVVGVVVSAEDAVVRENDRSAALQFPCGAEEPQRTE
jgi:hypothetical protein